MSLLVHVIKCFYYFFKPTSADISEDSLDEASPDVPNLARSASGLKRREDDSSSVVRVKRTDKPVSCILVENLNLPQYCTS